MNNKKFFVVVAVAVTTLIISIMFYGSAVRRGGLQRSVDELSELIVVFEPDMPGLFSADGEMFGYQYDLLKAYADNLGLPLRVIPASTHGECEKMLHGAQANLAVGLSSHFRKPASSVQAYATSYSVIAGRSTARSFSSGALFCAQLEGKKVLLSPGFKASGNYDLLLDSLKSARLFVAHTDVSTMAAEVAEGSYDFMICEKSEARFVCLVNRSVTRILDFKEEVPVWITASPRIAGLGADFERWLCTYRNGDGYATLDYHYFDGGMADRMARYDIAATGPGRISAYDDIMREVCDREGADWRLISAIAYTESRFKPNVVSHKGAKGLMQIMPVVSRQFGVADEEVLTPEVNITLGVKLLDRIESMMKLPAGVSKYDRMALVLASYNCGIGHVADARRLATKHGYDPNSWNDVALFLQKKADIEYFKDEVVRNGIFRGSPQTLAFVEGVMGRYTTYCAMAAL